MADAEAIQRVNIMRHILTDDGTFPNNGLLPLLVYKNVLPNLPEQDPAKSLEDIFAKNDWTNAWRNGVYDFHHYHSTAHEALGVFQGSARIQFGGPSGVVIHLETGDVVVIPAGVAHKAVEVYDNFTVVGAYPIGQNYDMNYGKDEERNAALENIKALPLPLTDPIYGTEGPLLTNWNIVF